MSEEMIAPCPFCGAKAERFTIGEEEPTSAGGDAIGCTGCGASSHVEFGRKENLVSSWNTRAYNPNERLREALEENVKLRKVVAVAADAIDVADSIIDINMGTGTPKEWNRAILAVVKARSALSPLPQGEDT